MVSAIPTTFIYLLPSTHCPAFHAGETRPQELHQLALLYSNPPLARPLTPINIFILCELKVSSRWLKKPPVVGRSVKSVWKRHTIPFY